MLAREDHALDFHRILSMCERRLRIPERYRQSLERRAEPVSVPVDRRQHLRRKLVRLAVLAYGQSLPALPRNKEFHVIQFLDISRGGVGFLHSEQLYPGERLSIHLEIGKELVVEIANCRRMSPACYHIGGRLACGAEEAPLAS